MNTHSWHKHTLINHLQTFFLLFSIAGLCALIGWLVLGTEGVFILLMTFFILLLFTPRLSPKIIIQLYHSQKLQPQHLPGLYSSLVRLSKKSGLTFIPDIYYIPSSMINAFSVGRRLIQLEQSEFRNEFHPAHKNTGLPGDGFSGQVKRKPGWYISGLWH